ncbi:hypothetical protein EDB83DRAFT_2529947 [Lactarius deliciosus]|nr:hypothetical protein EDB83DRAFT_2529947 [Lactarius deliciosus]
MHDDFLAVSARLRLTHLALPHFVGVPPPDLAAALARGRPPRCVTLRIASAQYGSLHPATLFCALGAR